MLKYSEINLPETEQSALPTDFLQWLWQEDSPWPVKTSGSTGKPKTIELQKQHMLASAHNTLDFLRLSPGDRALLCLPPDRIGGLMMIVRTWEGDLDLSIVPPSATPLEELEGEFAFAAMVPYQVSHSLESLHRIRKLIIGGGVIPPQLEKELKGLHGEIWHTYGMTETISHVAMRRVNGKDSDVYQAMPGVSFTTDTRQCLIIDAPDIGVKTLRTNDVAELVNAHSFRWLGRFDNVVNSGGVKLFPERIEGKIGEWDYPFFLAGLPDEELGEKLVMVVESGQNYDKEQVQHLFSKLDRYEVPKEIVSIRSFEYTANGKLNRPKTLLKI